MRIEFSVTSGQSETEVTLTGDEDMIETIIQKIKEIPDVEVE